jgi:hypothetical protein
MTTPHTPSVTKTKASPRTLLSVVALATGLLALAPVTGRAGVFTYTTATGTGADAQVHYDQPWNPGTADTNYGADGYPGIKFYNQDISPDLIGKVWSMKSYLRFDTTGLSGTATGASFALVFEAVSGTNVLNVYGLLDSAPGQNWGESTITWNNAPGNDTTSDSGVTSAAVLLGTWVVSGNGAQSFSSANLVNFVNADTDRQLTFILTNQTANTNVQFGAKEANPGVYPTLSVTVPEPASALILLAGAGSLALGRRRRDGR